MGYPPPQQNQARLTMIAASFKKGGLGAEIDFSIEESSVGLMVVATTKHGLCLVGLGNNKEQLRKQILIEFPKAVIKRRDIKLEHYLKALRDLTDLGVEPTKSLPLDIEATSFQRLVWETLLKIPLGKTMSYGDIAKHIRKTKAARAVGRACATNSIAILIPCHRVIGFNGDLTGYRWGKERKKALLDLEKHSSVR